MVVISKEMFQNKIKDHTCHDVIHKWHPNCFKAVLMGVTGGQSKGVLIYFIAMYAAQYLIQRKKLTAADIKQILKDFLQSVIFCHIFIASGMTALCLQTNILGKLIYYPTVFGPGAMAGITTFLSPKSRFPIEATVFQIAALTTFLKLMSWKRVIPRNKLAGTPLFMISNALMMFLLWHKQNTINDLKITWIFKPFSSKESSENKICSHEGSCKQDFYKVTSKYILIGAAISLINFILKCVKKKHVNIFELLDKSYLKFPVFLGSYVGIYKGIHCWLTQRKGSDSPNHALIAGLVAGILYMINPNLSIAASQIILVVKAVLREMQKKYKIPKLPYNYLFYILSCSIITYSWILCTKLIPGSIVTMISLVSEGRDKVLRNHLETLINS